MTQTQDSTEITSCVDISVIHIMTPKRETPRGMNHINGTMMYKFSLAPKIEGSVELHLKVNDGAEGVCQI